MGRKVKWQIGFVMWGITGMVGTVILINIVNQLVVGLLVGLMIAYLATKDSTDDRIK